MAIINTFDDLKIFLNNLKKIRINALLPYLVMQIIGYLNIYPLNKKRPV